MTADQSSPPSRAPAAGVLTINGGSSSIKFAVFAPAADGATEPRRSLNGAVDRIGSPGTRLTAKGEPGEKSQSQPIDASNHEQGASRLAQWLQRHLGESALSGVGHRIVHGGVHVVDHQVVTDDL